MIFAIIQFLIAGYVIYYASTMFDRGAVYIGRGLPNGVKGATINAVGSSLPEFSMALIGLLTITGEDGFAFGLGVTAGSAVYNLLVIPAMALLLGTIHKPYKTLSKATLWRDGGALLLLNILFLLFFHTTLYWYHGALLMLFYVLYIAFIYYQTRVHKTTYKDSEHPHLLDTQDIIPLATTKKQALQDICISLPLIIGGAYFFVGACEVIAESLQIPLYFIAVVLAAAASSFPDTLLSILDAKKGNYDDAFSNALGSNLFDIGICLGLPILIYTLINGQLSIGTEMSLELTMLQFTTVFTTLFFLVVLLLYPYIRRFHIVWLLGLYILFLLFIVGTIYKYPFVLELRQFIYDIFR